MSKWLKSSWMKYVVVLLVISILGLVGFLIPHNHEKWKFLFENMIWLPLEILITVFAFNKVVASIEKRKSHERFIKVVGKKTEALIFSIKKYIVAIPVNCQIYDADRDEEKLFEKIIENPEQYFNEKLFNSHRPYMFGENTSVNYNYYGIAYVACSSIDTELKKYLDRYAGYLEDGVFELIVRFEQSNQNMGVLSSPKFVFEKDIILGEGNGVNEMAINYLQLATQLINTLEACLQK